MGRYKTAVAHARGPIHTISVPAQSIWDTVFPFIVGLWLAITFVKFGNPIIFENLIQPPQSLAEWTLDSWPIRWGSALTLMVCAFGLPAWRWKAATLIPKWLLVMPAIWLCWQLVSSPQTISGPITQKTVLHFLTCTTCFYLGLFCLSHTRNQAPVWCGLLLGLLYSLWAALGQHFGGLEQTRRFLENMRWELYPPEMKARFTSREFQLKIASSRIWGTFIYPNALAGGIILALPVSLAWVWQLTQRFPFVVRGVLLGSIAYIGLACLYWSGSKAGWLIVMGLAFLGMLRIQFPSKWIRAIAVLSLLVIGLAGFYEAHSGYFAKKNNSAKARADYWEATRRLWKEKPLFGSGPGTFMLGYQRLKRPDSEPAKLAHNDYLQQACDSGLVGFLSYIGFVAGSIAGLYRRMRKAPDLLRFSVWLGLAGFAVQEIVEFSLYIPALAWPFFLLLGWLWGSMAVAKPPAEMASTSQPPLP